MGKVHVKHKSIVVPGELIADGDIKVIGPIFYHNNKVYSTRISLIDVSEKQVKVIPLAGAYIPKKEDLVIGRIIEVLPVGWQVDINSPYTAFLPLKEAVTDFVDITKTDLSIYYDIGEYVIARVVNVTKRGVVHVSTKGPGLRKIKGGIIVSITPSKVPRVIGKKGSMLQMIKQITGASVIVGQNGRIWIYSKDSDIEALVAGAVKLIEEKSHISGLTDLVKKFLEDGMKKIIEKRPRDSQKQN